MNQKTLTKVLGCTAALFGIVAFIMMFLAAVSTGGDDPTTYTGAELAFGKSLGSMSLWGQSGETKIVFSFGVLLAYVLPLASAVLLALAVFTKKQGFKFIFGCVAFGCFVAGIILLVLVRNMAVCQITTTILGTTSVSNYHFDDYEMGIGAILAIVFAALGACTAGSYTVLQLLKNGKKR